MVFRFHLHESAFLAEKDGVRGPELAYRGAFKVTKNTPDNGPNPNPNPNPYPTRQWLTS